MKERLRRTIGTISAAIALGTINPSQASADHLMDKDSGFEKARQGEPVRVWTKPTLDLDLEEIIKPWNEMAGWELFDKVKRRKQADVVFKPSDVTWVQAFPSYETPFSRVIIWVSPTYQGDEEAMQHEIGHALGFGDHVFESSPNQDYNLVCDNPAHPRYSPYHGVMSYCDWRDEKQWFGREDKRMLKKAGYKNQNRNPNLVNLYKHRRV